MITPVLINGEVSDGRIAVTDSSVLRGDGCFEVLIAHQGRPFALDEHLDRLEKSANALEIGLPERATLNHWVNKTAADLGDGAVRVVVTRGAAVPGLDDCSKVIVFGHTFGVAPNTARLLPVPAPWHAAGLPWALAGAKTLSYAPNLASGRRARGEGFDDALLVTADGVILEGPTFSVAWVVGEVLETPTLELGILDSITRRTILDFAEDMSIAVHQGQWELGRLDRASEVMALSTIRGVQPVAAIGGHSWDPGPVTARLASRYAKVAG